MAKRRSTFGKLQRERDKKAKLEDKRERRAARTEEGRDPSPEDGRQYDESEVLAALATLHRSYAEGNLAPDDFESGRAELSNRLRVD